jgi:hypothetical protein
MGSLLILTLGMTNFYNMTTLGRYGRGILKDLGLAMVALAYAQSGFVN